MMKDGTISQNSMPSSEFSSRDEAREKVAEVFKRVDMFLRSGDISHAQEELKLANQLRKELYQNNPFSLLKSERCILPQAPLPLKPVEAMLTAISSAKPRQSTSLQSAVPQNNTSMEKPKASKPGNTVDRKQEFDCYREALVDAWRDGALAQNEIRQLQELRSVLEISENEHNLLEKEIKYLCYKEAVLKHLASNPAMQPDTKLLTDLQQKFHITQLEHAYIQNQFLQSTKNKQRDNILVIDEDIQFLKALSVAIADEGFNLFMVTTSDEAYSFLQKHTPDLILCDVNLRTSSMNGLTFFNKIQENELLQPIPFIFLTGFTNEEVIRTVKEIGADDYLAKPLSKRALVSTLRGKLKRFRQLRGMPITPTSTIQ